MSQQVDALTTFCDLYKLHRGGTITPDGYRSQWERARKYLRKAHGDKTEARMLDAWRWMLTHPEAAWWRNARQGYLLAVTFLKCGSSATKEKLDGFIASGIEMASGNAAWVDQNEERDDVWRYLRSEAADGTEELFADDPHLTPRAIAALAACGGSRALLGDIARGAKGDSLGFAWRSWKEAWAGAISAAATTDTTDAARAARRTG